MAFGSPSTSSETEEVHRLSSDLPPAARPLLRFMLRSVLTSEAHGGAQDTLPAEERAMSATGLLSRLATLFHTMPFRSLLDTTPWRRTLGDWMNFERINSPAAPALLLAATELQTGALRVFCNRELSGQPADTIILDHLMASSSIPIVYPWTEIGSEKYWDGAVLANTPLEPVIDLAGDGDVDILVVTTKMQSNHPVDCNLHHRPRATAWQNTLRPGQQCKPRPNFSQCAIYLYLKYQPVATA